MPYSTGKNFVCFSVSGDCLYCIGQRAADTAYQINLFKSSLKTLNLKSRNSFPGIFFLRL